MAPGVPKISFSFESFYFCEFKVRVKFQNPTLSPYGVLIRRRERKKVFVNVAISLGTTFSN